MPIVQSAIGEHNVHFMTSCSLLPENDILYCQLSFLEDTKTDGMRMHFNKSNVRAVSLITWIQGVTLIYTEGLHNVMLHWGTFHHGLQDCTMLCMSNILGKLMTHREMGKCLDGRVLPNRNL